MSFTVCAKKRKRMAFVRVLCVLMIALLTWGLSWEPMREHLAQDNVYVFFWGMIGVFLLLFAFSFYAQRRPRIEVNGQNITFYPMWRPAERVTLSEITSRKEKADYSDPNKAVVAGALGGALGALLVHAVTRRNTSTLETPNAMIYTYYKGSAKLITASTREMDNLEQFDRLVVDKLEGRQPPAGFAAAELEAVPEKRSPLLLAGLIGAVCVLVVGAVIFVLPGKGDPAPVPSDPSPGQEDTTGKVTYSTQGVSFEVPADWTQAEGTDLFYTADGQQVYGLNGVSALGSYTPQEFFELITEYYGSSGQFDSLESPDELYSWKFGDDVECQVADLVGYQGSVLYCTKLVIAPRKNLVLTFCGQVHRDYAQGPAGVQYALNRLCDKLTFEIGDEDYISGNTFLCGDGSQLCLQADGGFRYYQSAEDHENQYYEGEYEVYYGQAAMDKAASMTEYGLTVEELERVLSVNMNGYIPGGSRPSDYFYATGELEDNRERYQVCLATFYAVILHNQRLVRSPEDVTEGGNSTLYIGFYLPELEMADLTNCNAMSYTQWTFQEKTD